MVFFWLVGFSLVPCASWECQLCWSFPFNVQDLGFKDVPPAVHALWAEYGGGIIFVPPGEFAGQHKILPVGSVGCFVVFMVASCIC